MNRICIGITILLFPFLLISSTQMNRNLSFEEIEHGMPAYWWDYNNSPSNGTWVKTSEDWASDGNKSVMLKLEPDANPNWCGIGQRLRIEPSGKSSIKKLYVSANVLAKKLNKAHIKLEAKLLKKINEDGEHEYYVIEENRVTEPGPQTLAVVLDIPREIQKEHVLQIDVNFVLGSDFENQSENASGTVYVDEVITRYIK